MKYIHRDLITVSIDKKDLFDSIEDDDLLEEVKNRNLEVEPSFKILRDQDIYEAFVEAKKKYTYEELMKRLS